VQSLARLPQDAPRALDDGPVDHRAVQGQHALALPVEGVDDLPGPLDLPVARREDAVDRLDLGRMDAGLAAETERAGELGLLLEPDLVLEVEMDGVEGAVPAEVTADVADDADVARGGARVGGVLGPPAGPIEPKPVRYPPSLSKTSTPGRAPR